jgi:hypothetical protein
MLQLYCRMVQSWSQVVSSTTHLLRVSHRLAVFKSLIRHYKIQRLALSPKAHTYLCVALVDTSAQQNRPRQKKGESHAHNCESEPLAII